MEPSWEDSRAAIWSPFTRSAVTGLEFRRMIHHHCGCRSLISVRIPVVTRKSQGELKIALQLSALVSTIATALALAPEIAFA